jgi:3',5'-cyclic AMP phosphodiesterase CpdA
MVQRVGPTSATIVVETDRPARVDVAWTGDPAGGERHAAAVTGDGRRHLAELAGLPPAARVAYEVSVDGAKVVAASFATAPRAGDIVRLAVYGDVRGGHATHAALVGHLVDDAPDAVLFTGDLVLRGTDEGDWQRFFAIAQPLLATTPYYPVLGNHDVGAAGDRQRRFADRFALPPAPPGRPAGAAYYSVDVGEVHVVALDSNAYDVAAQRAWLEQDLAAADGARAVIAITHDGPFSRGTHGGNPLAARDYVPVLARHHVAVLFSGHDHLYQRGVAGGLPYVVSGGGGAPLYPVRCGVRRRPRCHDDDGMIAFASAHHDVLVTVYPTGLELCPRLADGSPLEPCVHLPLRP